MRGRQEIREHVGRVMNSVEGHLAPIGRDNRLMQSWSRSLKIHQVDPGLSNLPRVLTAVEVREHCDRLGTFVRIARHGVDRLFQQVSVANYCALLTDASGVTVALKTVPALEREFRDEGFRIGTCWSEREEGTCGIGTTIMDTNPTLVHKYEHFRAHNIAFSCSAAPVFGLNGELLAVLDASALYPPDNRDTQLLVFNIVTNMAQLIENAFAFDCLRKHWILQMSRSPEFLDVDTEHLVAFDDSGSWVAIVRRDTIY